MLAWVYFIAKFHFILSCARSHTIQPPYVLLQSPHISLPLMFCTNQQFLMLINPRQSLNSSEDFLSFNPTLHMHHHILLSSPPFTTIEKTVPTHTHLGNFNFWEQHSWHTHTWETLPFANNTPNTHTPGKLYLLRTTLSTHTHTPLGNFTYWEQHSKHTHLGNFTFWEQHSQHTHTWETLPFVLSENTLKVSVGKRPQNFFLWKKLIYNVVTHNSRIVWNPFAHIHHGFMENHFSLIVIFCLVDWINSTN